MLNVEKYLGELLEADDKFSKLIELAELNPCSASDLIEWLFAEVSDE